jgi:hypothetical protein
MELGDYLFFGVEEERADAV